MISGLALIRTCLFDQNATVAEVAIDGGGWCWSEMSNVHIVCYKSVMRVVPVGCSGGIIVAMRLGHPAGDEGNSLLKPQKTWEIES